MLSAIQLNSNTNVSSQHPADVAFTVYLTSCFKEDMLVFISIYSCHSNSNSANGTFQFSWKYKKIFPTRFAYNNSEIFIVYRQRLSWKNSNYNKLTRWGFGTNNNSTTLSPTVASFSLTFLYA